MAIRVTRPSSAEPLTVDSLRSARACDNAATVDAPEVLGGPSSPELAVKTDDAGRFCVRVSVGSVAQSAFVVWKGSALIDGAQAELRLDLARASVDLSFESVPRILSLGAARTLVAASATVEHEHGSAKHPARGLPLSLHVETGEVVGRATTDSDGRATFAVDTPRLGGPGPGELRIAFDGDRSLAAASETMDVERHAAVSLSLLSGADEARAPDEGVRLLVQASTPTSVAATGVVEALFGNEVVGAAAVENGKAHVLATFIAPAPSATVRLRYRPSAPWFEPGSDLHVVLPVREASPSGRLPLFFGVVALAMFFVARRGPRKPRQLPETMTQEPSRTPKGTAGVALVRAATARESGYFGVVRDADDLQPVPGAIVRIERASFEGRAVLASVAADASGRFDLPAVSPRSGGESLTADARLHASLSIPLPAEGELAIALMLRRRALLDRLVRWARRTGRPYDARPEPTPGHVQRVATVPETARWAQAVEQAAFGPIEVDAEVERQAEANAPFAPSHDVSSPRSSPPRAGHVGSLGGDDRD